jgi:hypothetical protein
MGIIMAKYVRLGREIKYSQIFRNHHSPISGIQKISSITPTRLGHDSNDKSTPFYTEDYQTLKSYYWHSNDEGLNIPYTDLIGFKTSQLLSVFPSHLDGTDGAVTINVAERPYTLPDILKQQGDHALDLYKKLGRIRQLPDGLYENNVSLRITDIKEDTIYCETATYFDQIATNIIMDWDSGLLGSGASIRNNVDIARNGQLLPLAASRLANTLGVCAMFYNRSLEPLVRIRKPNLGALPAGGLHCTVSGVYSFADRRGDAYDLDVLGRGMVAEILRETGLTESEFIFLPVAFGRELPRGGKPQLFYIAISLVDDKDLRMKANRAEEADEYIRFADGGEISPKGDINYSYFSKYDRSAFTYEGLASLFICDRFIEMNKTQIEIFIDTADQVRQLKF